MYRVGLRPISLNNNIPKSLENIFGGTNYFYSMF